MKQVILIPIFLVIVSFSMSAQTADTVTVDLAKTSKIVFTMQDRSDLEELKQYDFGALFADMLNQLEQSDSLTTPTEDSSVTFGPNFPFDDDDNMDEDVEVQVQDNYHYRTKHIWHSIDFDFGINNYLENGKFPDYSGAQYTVRPWGSWYIGINSVLHTDVGQNFFVEWGFGVSWYNFKFQEDNTLITKTPTETTFTPDPRDLQFEKSKLSATYLNVSIIPMWAFGSSNCHDNCHHHHHSSFRIGIGPYAGYRIESHSKLVYDDGGDKNKEKDKDNFYLNNFRYGLKLKFGTRGVEFFTAYDLNPLFADGKGPDLHAITFGLVF